MSIRRIVGLAVRQVAMASCLAMGVGAVHAATEVAPYFYTWGFGNGAYKVKSLTEARTQAGMTAATLAFGVSGGACTLGGGMEYTLNNAAFKSDIQQFNSAGGRLILSFGGAAGQYLESTCSETDMVNLIKGLLDTHNVRAIDFDVEGSQLANAQLNGVRNNVIKRLQTLYPGLYVSFTLPVLPYLNQWNDHGLPTSAVALLQGAVQAGVRISMVNIMAMDYGAAYSSGKKMGELAISAANETFAQIKPLFPGKTDAQIWALIGVTPMIGQNDIASEIFTPSDAQMLVTFAKQKGLGLLSMWAMQRDQIGSGGLDVFSKANTRDYEFIQILNTAKSGATTPAPAPSPAPGPSPAPSPAPSCSTAAWSASQVYTGGQRASYSGVLYEAKWWTQGENPAQSGPWGVWKVVGSCGVTTAPSPAPAPTPVPSPVPSPAPAPVCMAWAEGKSYAAGTVVSYQGKQYRALVTHTAWVGAGWNPASTPTLWQPTGGSTCQ